MRRWTKLALAAAALVVADQAALFLALGDGELFGRRVAPYDPPVFHQGQREELERLRRAVAAGAAAEASMFDAELGWCPPRGAELAGERYDEAGTRVGNAPLPPERREGRARIAALGCSFTFDLEVAAAESWPAQLERLRPALELANLGVPAYGLDQALLRYRRDGRRLAADEVWLGFFPSAAQRVTTLYRPAQRHWAGTLRFKPRFALDARGELELVPNPAASLADSLALLTDQRRFFDALRAGDRWVARCPAAWAPAGSRLAHRSAAGRALLTLYEVRERDPLAELRDPEHETHRLVRALVLRLRDEVEADGARFRLLVMPGPTELAEAARGDASWRALSAELVERGVEVLDPSADMAAHDAEQPGALFAPHQHFSAGGSGWLASWLAARLEAEGAAR